MTKCKVCKFQKECKGVNEHTGKICYSTITGCELDTDKFETWEQASNAMNIALTWI